MVAQLWDGFSFIVILSQESRRSGDDSLENSSQILEETEIQDLVPSIAIKQNF